jgi:MFS family permease
MFTGLGLFLRRWVGELPPTVGWLGLCFALSGTSASLTVSAAALVGLRIAENPAWATLPLSLNLLGTMSSGIPASLLMQRIGRRNGFRLGTVVGLLGALLNIYAIQSESFILFCLGSYLIGCMLGFGQLYRFAAIEVTPEEHKARAVSLVLLGGIVSGILGPGIAFLTKDWVEGAPFIGSYWSLIGLYITVFLLLQLVDLPKPTASEQQPRTRRFLEITRQTSWKVSVLSAALGYAAMALIMTATPLSMQAHHHSFSESTFVIQWHVIAMFLPSFITGNLIQRFGNKNIMLLGIGLNLICILINTQEQFFLSYWSALILLGVGWNFMFIAGTTLLTETYRPEEKALVQGVNDALVFGSAASGSLLAGILQNQIGWESLNAVVAPALLLLAGWLFWLKRKRGILIQKPIH